ncbi:MAG: Flp pilus assembly complex ATPase component TadA, partial [Planctomycetes bacterium]|nr:Flp pilus assembly complex ATPase component TadA [Planctomycetota bacterium]
MDEKVYELSDDKTLSMRDLLNYFKKHGPLRVSDLHLKVGSPAVYRIDGLLQPLKGNPLDKSTLRALAQSLLDQSEMERLNKERAVDSSYSFDTLQFRINCFYDTDGLCLAIRSLLTSPPTIEEIGFPNDIWKDIVEKQQVLFLLTGITGAGKSTTIAS